MPVYPCEKEKRALALNASAEIPVHDHPSGDATPNPSDIEMTEEICFALKTVGVTVHDHMIISAKDEFFFSQNKLLL